MFTVKADTHGSKRLMFEASYLRVAFINEFNEYCVELFDPSGNKIYENLHVGHKAPYNQLIVENANGKTSEIIRTNTDGGMERQVAGH